MAVKSYKELQAHLAFFPDNPKETLLSRLERAKRTPCKDAGRDMSQYSGENQSIAPANLPGDTN
jgi:hypothetical protein